MHITRKQSWAIAGSLLAVFAGVALGFSGQQKSFEDMPSLKGQLTPPPETGGASGQFVLNNFHRSEMRDGKPVWEVKAENGNYSPQNGSATLTSTTLWLYRNNGVKVELHAQKATLTMKGTSLQDARLEDKVRLNYNDTLSLATELAVYNKEKEQVLAPGTVKIKSDMLDIDGQQLSADLARQEITLHRRVRSVVRPGRSNVKFE